MSDVLGYLATSLVYLLRILQFALGGFAVIFVAGALQQALGDVEADLGPEVREQLDRIEASAATVEERTNQIQRDVEGLQR